MGETSDMAPPHLLGAGRCKAHIFLVSTHCHKYLSVSIKFHCLWVQKILCVIHLDLLCLTWAQRRVMDKPEYKFIILRIAALK